MSKCIHWILAAIVIGAGVLIGGSMSGYLPAGQVEKEETIAIRLKELEDREEIRQLLVDYGRNLDRRDFAAVSQLFSEREGEWIGGFGRAKNRDAIRKLMEKSIGPSAGGRVQGIYGHLFTNEHIRVDGDTASATTIWILVVQGSGSRPQPLLLGHFDDTLIRENGRWRFLRHVIYGDIPQDDPWTKK